MTRAEMTQLLSETIYVTGNEAEAALEASAGNISDAAQLLLREQRARTKRAGRDGRRAEATPCSALRAFLARVGLGRPAPAAR